MAIKKTSVTLDGLKHKLDDRDREFIEKTKDIEEKDG